MPIVIEQTQLELAASQVLTANANILSVRVISANYWRKPVAELNAVSSSLSVEVTFSPNSIVQAERQLRADVEFACRIFPKPKIETSAATDTDSEAEDVIRVECILEASYQLAESFSPSEDQMQAFHNGNVVYNCWPYFREFVQSSAARMEIPPPPIPFLKMQIKRPSEAVEAAEEPTNK